MDRRIDQVYEPAGLSRSPHKAHQVSLLVRPWLCWPRSGAVSSLRRSPRPGPCRPEPACEGRRRRTPAEVQRVRRIPRTAFDEGMKASLTLRCDVVTSFSLLQDGWSLSKMMVSAPLQYSVSLPSGLRTGVTEEVWTRSRSVNAATE